MSKRHRGQKKKPRKTRKGSSPGGNIQVKVIAVLPEIVFTKVFQTSHDILNHLIGIPFS